MTRLVRTMLAAAATLAIAVPTMAAQPVPTSVSITANPNTIAPGGSTTVTATLTPDTGTVNCGKGQIQYNIFDITVSPAVSLTGGWVQLANNIDVASNTFSAVFDSSVIAVAPGQKVSFRAGFAPSGGCDYSSIGPGQSPTTDLLIIPPDSACPNGQTTGVHVSIVGPNGVGNPPPGYSGNWTFIVRVQACEDLTNVTAQGGANGWTDNPKTILLPYIGSVAPYVKNRNTVYLWTIGDMTEGQAADLMVQVSGSIKNTRGECGKVKLLNGDWSAMYTDVSGLRSKSDYTSYTASIEVTCP